MISMLVAIFTFMFIGGLLLVLFTRGCNEHTTKEWTEMCDCWETYDTDKDKK